MKRRDFERHIESHGCAFSREGAHHAVFVNLASGKHSTVPRHNELRRGLVIKICKDLEIPIPLKGW